MLETALKTLFDYQRLEKSTALEAVIDEVLDRYSQTVPLTLTDDEVALAAGGLAVFEEEKQRGPDT